MKRHFKGHRPIALTTLIAVLRAVANSIRLLLAMPLLALALACPKPIIPPEPEIPPPPAVNRTPVSRPKLIENHAPQSITVPPEMIGKLIRARVWVGEDGKVSRCAILDKDIGPDIKTIATAIAMNMVFSPALDGDDKPIASDTVVAFSL